MTELDCGTGDGNIMITVPRLDCLGNKPAIIIVHAIHRNNILYKFCNLLEACILLILVLFYIENKCTITVMNTIKLCMKIIKIILSLVELTVFLILVS